MMSFKRIINDIIETRPINTEALCKAHMIILGNVYPAFHIHWEILTFTQIWFLIQQSFGPLLATKMWDEKNQKGYVGRKWSISKVLLWSYGFYLYWYEHNPMTMECCKAWHAYTELAVFALAWAAAIAVVNKPV